MPPQDPTEGNKNNIDLSKILLPKKDAPSVDSAQRVNAGILLEQEIAAGAGVEEVREQKSGQPPVEGAPRTFVSEASSPPPPTPKNDDAVKPLQTYRGDIEELVQGTNVSVVSIAAAEAQRRGQQAAGSSANTATVGGGKEDAPILRNTLMIAGGVVLLAAVAGIAAYFLTRSTTVPVTQNPTVPFILVDNTTVAAVQPNFSRDSLMPALVDAQKKVALSLGLVARVYVGTASSSGETLMPVDAQTLLATLAPGIPQDLLRTIDPSYYLLGIHSYDQNQPFFIFKVDSYQQAFSGILAWERTMQNDLSPLFTRTPSPHIQATATSTATSTPQIAQTGFVDKIVENHDARVIQNQFGDILLLWTFLDRNTLVITTNEATLRELISRLEHTSLVPQP